MTTFRTNTEYRREYPPRNPFPLSCDEVRITRNIDRANSEIDPRDESVEYAVMLNRALEMRPL